jgi:hypothetical protein
MGCQMKTLARIVCISALFLAPAAWIGADDTEQTKPLFDQVREAIPKLKHEMSKKEVDRLLQVDKLRHSVFLPSSLSTPFFYSGFGKESQSLVIVLITGTDTVVGATLRDGNKIVAQFDVNKK